MSVLNLILRQYVVGPPARTLFPARVVGRENLPKEGPFIIAAGPHRTELESVLLACNLPEYELHFFAKQDYWHGSALRSWFMDGTGMLPIDREDNRAAVRQIEQGAELLHRGGIVAVYPEGTRGGDDFVHKGHTGVARTALRAIKLRGDVNVPIIPVGMIGMRRLNPPKAKRIKFRPGRCTIVIGEPILPFSHTSDESHLRPRELAKNVAESGSMWAGLATGAHARILTNRVMEEIARLSTTAYLDEYLKTGEAGRKK